MIEPRDLTFKQKINKDEDSYLSVINDTPLVTHFYYLHKNMLGPDGNNFKPISQSGLVLNLLYMPFLKSEDLSVYVIDYDQKNLGTVADKGSDPAPNVKVYKLWQAIIEDKEIGKSFNKYPKFNRKAGQKHWTNESKIWQYPYHYLSLNDYINAPLVLNPQYLDKLENKVMVSQPITITGGYTLYVKGYKGDYKGNNEGLFSAAGLDLPTGSSQYAQFMANSKSSFLKQVEIAKRNEEANSLASIPNMITSAISGATLGATVGSVIPGIGTVGGGILGAGGAALNTFFGSAIRSANERRNALESSQAQVEDLFRAPRSVNLSSSDILMTMDRNEKKLWINRYTINDYYKEKLCNYWTLYGYKQNKLMYKERNGLIKTRRHFNYIKTIDANIYGQYISKSELDMINQIYDNGITFWHQREMEQDKIKMYDYHLDNVEMDRT